MSNAFTSLARALGTAFKESHGEPWSDDVFESWAQRVFTHQFETVLTDVPQQRATLLERAP